MIVEYAGSDAISRCIGRDMIRELKKAAKNKECVEIFLNSCLNVIGFWRKIVICYSI
jgi:hypothetical protein